MLTLLRRDNEEFAEIEWERFKRMMIAVHPERAKEIMEALSEEERESVYAPELTEEELDYAKEHWRTPGDQIEETISALREFGLVVD